MCWELGEKRESGQVDSGIVEMAEHHLWPTPPTGGSSGISAFEGRRDIDLIRSGA